MVPATILRRLGQLRRWERGVRFFWGVARTLALLAMLLGLCCLTDYLIDRWQDTPHGLLVGLLILQGLVALAALGFFVFRPQWQWLSDSTLALWVERKLPFFGQRLITAVQLNRPGAPTEGMSRELLDSVTRSAEQDAARTDFRQVADKRRLLWCLYVLAPVVLVGVILALVCPQTLAALLDRQLLGHASIPRSVLLANETAMIWPSGEPVTLTLQATGPGVQPELVGKVRLYPENGPAEDHPLTWQKPPEGSEQDATGKYEAQIPASWTGFQFRAWLGDGRTHEPGQIVFDPRPAVTRQQAWVILPEYCGLRPNGRRYEQVQDKADLTGFSGSSARLLLTFNKPVREAKLELLGTAPGGVEQVTRLLDLQLRPDGQSAEITFALQAVEQAYRIQLRDQHGFTNKHMPRRSITVLPDEAPLVLLLQERFAQPGQRGGLDDTEVDGMPVPLGEPFWVAYRCRTSVRLGKAQFRYRVLAPGMEVFQDVPPWQTLPLTEWKAAADVGDFDLNLGTFDKSSFYDEIEFHALPSRDPELEPGRHDGGGRFAFKTAGLPKLKVGDKVEFYVEVLDSRPTPLLGRSEVRVKDVVEEGALALWLKAKREETRRLQQLEARQSGLYDPAVQDKP